MTATSMNGAGKSAKLPRPSLSGQIDRLDSILDGLAEALDQSVEQAVRDCVGRVVRDAVEQAVREVLDDPELIRAALARHAPVAALAPDHPPAPPRRPLAEALGWLVALAAGKTSDTSKALGHGWAWALKKVQQAAGAAQRAAAAVSSALPWMAGIAYRHPGTCAVALGGAAVSLGGSLLAALCRPLGGR